MAAISFPAAGLILAPGAVRGGRKIGIGKIAAGVGIKPLAARTGLKPGLNIRAGRKLKPVVERFKIHHEKSVSEDRLKELGVTKWSVWECGPCVTTLWKWEVDELVYISQGSVEVVPDGCEDSAYFYAGDVVRFPKWFEASLTFEENYKQSYKFLAYGD